MNAKVLIVLVVILTLITAFVHLGLGGGMMVMGAMGGPRGGPGQFNAPANGQLPPDAGQAPGDGQNPPFAARRPGGPGGIMGALPILFLLNAVGYLALLALMVFPVPYFKDHPALTHWLLISFAALTFVLYFVMNGFGMFLRNPAAIIAKAAELLLIIFTFLHLQSVQKAASSSAPAAS